jgi:hypothetical protein
MTVLFLGGKVPFPKFVKMIPNLLIDTIEILARNGGAGGRTKPTRL